jgi:hypothetical protein
MNDFNELRHGIIALTICTNCLQHWYASKSMALDYDSETGFAQRNALLFSMAEKLDGRG